MLKFCAQMPATAVSPRQTINAGVGERREEGRERKRRGIERELEFTNPQPQSRLRIRVGPRETAK